MKVRNDTIQIQVDDCEKASRLLRENHIQIRRQTPAYKSLEDYYFELVGGKSHV